MENFEELSDIIVYQAGDGQLHFRGEVKRTTIWASQKQIAELFEVDVRTVNEHLKNIYKTNELEKESTIRKFRIVQEEGGRSISRAVSHYNLDAIISVGYRVNSTKATRFRIWATKVLTDHLVEGYTLDRKRIEENYTNFAEAVKRIQSLRLNEHETEDARLVLDIVQLFADTWLSLDAFDRHDLPQTGYTAKDVSLTAEELNEALQDLKQDLFLKSKASSIFGQEIRAGSLTGIINRGIGI